MTVGAPIGVAIGRPIGRLIGAGADGSWSANFLAGEFPSNITFTRASSATDFNDPSLSYATDVPVLNSRGLLIQGARTNLILQSVLPAGTPGTIGSGAVAPTSWAFGSSGGTVSYGTSSYGTGSITFTTASGTERPYIAQNQSVLANTTYSWSVLVTNITGTTPRVDSIISPAGRPAGATVTWYADGVALASGGSTSYSSGQVITAVLAVSATAGTVNARIGLNSETTGSVCSVTLTIPQFEVGAFRSSYIPTTTTSSTRAADVATISNLASIGFNPTQGTMLVEYQLIGLVGSTVAQRIVSFTGTAGNRILLQHGLGTSACGVSIDTASANQMSYAGGTTNAGVVGKIALGMALNNTGVSVNGISTVVDTSITLPTVTSLNIGAGDTGGGNPAFAYIRRLVYYPTRLSDAQLQALSAV